MYSFLYHSLFSKVEAANFRGHISDSQAAPAPLLPVYELDGAPTAAQVLVMGPDDFIVAMVRYASSGLDPARVNHSKQNGSWGWVGVKAPTGLSLTSTPSSLNRPFGSGLLTLRDPSQQPDARLLLAQQDSQPLCTQPGRVMLPILLGTLRLERTHSTADLSPSLFPLRTSVLRK